MYFAWCSLFLMFLHLICLMPHNLDCPSAALHCCGSDLLTELPLFLTISCSSILLCRRSTRWWALWSWCVWMRTGWPHSSALTRSSPRWTRTTTTRSPWKNSKRPPSLTRPSSYCCSVTCKSRERDGWWHRGREGSWEREDRWAGEEREGCSLGRKRGGMEVFLLLWGRDEWERAMFGAQSTLSVMPFFSFSSSPLCRTPL